MVVATTVALLVVISGILASVNPRGDGSARVIQEIASPAGSLSRLPVPVPAATSPQAGTLTISGEVVTHTPHPQPIAGVNVTVVGRPCQVIASPSTCPFVNATVTNESGFYSLGAPPGDYLVYAHNTSAWGGDWAAVSLSTTDVVANLVGYPWETYGNATFVLPHWNNLSAYASNCNAQPPCTSGIYGTQTPLLSWTDDGVYYVNATGRLVHFSFVNGSVRDVGYWRYLYDDLMNYQGIENTEWITSDGSYVYEFGCATDCSTAAHPILFAINTTTGRTFNHTFSSVSIYDLVSNTQLNLIGEDGNSSVAVLMGEGSELLGYNLWNQTEWILGTLPFFEANNIYWISQYNSFFNIEADGSSGDHIQQLRLEGPAPGTRLVSVYSGTFANQFVVNGVNGMYTNVTDHALLVSELTGGGPVLTQKFTLNSSGSLTGAFLTYPDHAFGSWPDDSAPPNVWSSEHRPSVVSDGPMDNGLWNGLFFNNSWLFEPSTGQFIETNLSYDHPMHVSALRESAQDPASVEGLFSNASYSLISESVNCRDNGTTCPIRGTADGTRPGTIWWSWRTRLPEFPFPGQIDGAETLPPVPVAPRASANATSITLTWNVNANDTDRILNYTLFWGPSGAGLPIAADLWGQNVSAVLTGLQAQTTYSFCLEAWNLHWHNSCAWINESTSPSTTPLSIDSFTASPSAVDAGEGTVLALKTSGGLEPLSFTYTGLPPGCAGLDAARLACSTPTPGVYSPTVTVRDSSGQSQSSSTSLTVGPPLGVAIHVSPPAVDVPSNITLSAVLTRPGTAPFTYNWTWVGGGGSGQTIEVPEVTPGNDSVSVVVTDGFGGHAAANATIEVFPRLELSLTRAPGAVVDEGVPYWLNTTVTGGAGGSSILFSELPSGCQISSGVDAGCLTSTLGPNPIAILATDRAGGSSAWSGSETITSDPTATLAADATNVGIGGAIHLSGAVTGGVSPFRFSYSGLPRVCPAPGTDPANLTCTPDEPGTYRITLTVVDADGQQSTAGVTVTVTPSAATSAGSVAVLDWIEVSIVAGVAAIILAVILAWRRGRRRSPPR